MGQRSILNTTPLQPIKDFTRTQNFLKLLVYFITYSMEKTESVLVGELRLRPYQAEMLERSLKGTVIIAVLFLVAQMLKVF